VVAAKSASQTSTTTVATVAKEGTLYWDNATYVGASLPFQTQLATLQIPLYMANATAIVRFVHDIDIDEAGNDDEVMSVLINDNIAWENVAAGVTISTYIHIHTCTIHRVS
jgi:hypothetical protein